MLTALARSYLTRRGDVVIPHGPDEDMIAVHIRHLAERGLKALQNPPNRARARPIGDPE